MQVIFRIVFFFFFSNHLSTLPLVLVFGIATAMTAVHRLMPHSVSSLLCMEKFQVAPATVYFTEVIEKVGQSLYLSNSFRKTAQCINPTRQMRGYTVVVCPQCEMEMS